MGGVEAEVVAGVEGVGATRNTEALVVRARVSA